MDPYGPQICRPYTLMYNLRVLSRVEKTDIQDFNRGHKNRWCHTFNIWVIMGIWNSLMWVPFCTACKFTQELKDKEVHKAVSLIHWCIIWYFSAGLRELTCDTLSIEVFCESLTLSLNVICYCLHYLLFEQGENFHYTCNWVNMHRVYCALHS